MLNLPGEVRPMNRHGHKPWRSTRPMKAVSSHLCTLQKSHNYPTEEGKEPEAAFPSASQVL